MKSKKFLTRVLTGALAISMLAGMGICADAVETEDVMDAVVVSEDNDISATQSWLSKLLNGLPKEIVKKIMDEFKNNGSEPPKPTVVQKICNFVMDLKSKADRFIFSHGEIYFKDSYYLFQVHISLREGVTADMVAYYPSHYGETNITIDIPAYAMGIPVTKVSMFAEMDDETTENVTAINLPATINELDGQNLCDLYHLKNIYIDPENPCFCSIDGVAFTKDGSTLVAFPAGRKAYSIPMETTAIGDYAFFESSIEGIYISPNVTYIGDYAFNNCLCLESFRIPYGVEYVGEGAFMYSSNLKSVYVPVSVKNIGTNAFYCVAEDFYIKGEVENGYASQYAEENDIPYKFDLAMDLEKVFEEPIDDINMKIGTTVTFTANAKGGSEEGYKYSFLVRHEDASKWTVMQKFEENNVFAFKPAKLGLYEVCAKVMDSEGTIHKYYTQILVNEAFRNYSKLSADTIKKCETVTVTGIAEEGVENCTYAFYYKKVSDTKWTKKQDFSTNNVVKIKPAYAADYVVCVKIKNEDGFISKTYYDLKVTE